MVKIQHIKAVSFLVYSVTDETQLPGFMFPQVVQTLVGRGGITNCHSLPYCLSNISAKNYQNILICVEVIVCYISVVFLRHSVVRPSEYAYACFNNVFY